MTVYNQRIKFSIILGVLFFSIVCVIWYNNNISSRLNYVEKRISYLDDQITKGSTLPIKIENAFSKYNSKKFELDFFSNPDKDKEDLKDKIKTMAKNNRIKVRDIVIKETNYFKDIESVPRIDRIPFIRENIELSVIGNFLDIGLFLETMIKDSENLNLNKCDFNLDQNSDRQVQASIEFYTYYMEKT